jgi:hypothetical protein
MVHRGDGIAANHQFRPLALFGMVGKKLCQRQGGLSVIAGSGEIIRVVGAADEQEATIGGRPL